jgi:hypothetical protein
LQDRGVLGEDRAVIGAQRRHQAERIDAEKIRAVVLHAFCQWIDFEIICVGARLIERDAGRHRAGERRVIQVHGFLLCPHGEERALARVSNHARVAILREAAERPLLRMRFRGRLVQS